MGVPNEHERIGRYSIDVSWVWKDGVGQAPYISTTKNEWFGAILSVLRVADRMKQVDQSCVGAGIGAPE